MYESSDGIDLGAEMCIRDRLIKIIDAKNDLSIQVHPDDAYAGEHENGSLGKTECWYVLDFEPGTEIVIGHNAKDKAEVEKMIRNHEWSDFIRKVPVLSLIHILTGVKS